MKKWVMIIITLIFVTLLCVRLSIVSLGEYYELHLFFYTISVGDVEDIVDLLIPGLFVIIGVYYTSKLNIIEQNENRKKQFKLDYLYSTSKEMIELFSRLANEYNELTNLTIEFETENKTKTIIFSKENHIKHAALLNKIEDEITRMKTYCVLLVEYDELYKKVENYIERLDKLYRYRQDIFSHGSFLEIGGKNKTKTVIKFVYEREYCKNIIQQSYNTLDQCFKEKENEEIHLLFLKEISKML
jgi:hypothetical protein